MCIRDRNLAGIRQVSERACRLQVFNMCLGHFGAGRRKFFDGDKTLALPALHNIPGRCFAQAGHGNKGRQQPVTPDCKFQRFRLIQVNGIKGKPAQVKLLSLIHI